MAGWDPGVGTGRRGARVLARGACPAHPTTCPSSRARHAPSQSAAYEQLAWVEAAAPQPDIPAVNLIQAHFTLTNDKPRTLLALAMIRARLGDKEGALDLLASVRHMNPSPATEQAVRYVTARLSNAALVDETEQESRPQRIEIEVETPLPPVRPNQ